MYKYNQNEIFFTDDEQQKIIGLADYLSSQDDKTVNINCPQVFEQTYLFNLNK